VNDRLWEKGEIYELPEGMEKSEKNFQAIEETKPELKPESGAKPARPIAEKTKPSKIPKGSFWCVKCQSLHKETSKVGQKHLKYKE